MLIRLTQENAEYIIFSSHFVVHVSTTSGKDENLYL